MLKRKYLNDLVKWNNDPYRKPLLVLGARQVGKTYLVEDIFAKKYYKNRYLRIDCSNDNKFNEFVHDNANLDAVLEYISINYNFPIDSKHLLIFDEAQECLPIITMMKHFCEQKRHIPVIVTGSLVRIKINRIAHKRGQYAKNSFLFPVGKINQLHVYPMGFDEFLINYNENMYKKINEAYFKKINISQELHEMFLKTFNLYLSVGALPEVIKVFLETQKKDKINAYQTSKKVLKDIYDDYLNDMSLYQASPEAIVRSKLIFKNIFFELNKDNKNFKCAHIEKGSKTRDMMSPIDWLITANVVNKSSLLKEKVTSPLIADNSAIFRLYLADIGMFGYQNNYSNADFLSNQNTLSGIFYENYVAQELTSRGFDLFFWQGKRNHEFEFVLDIQGHIIPLDVKKTTGSLSSLDEFRYHNKTDLAIKISSNHFGFDKKKIILTIPYYFVPFVFDELKSNNFYKTEKYKKIFSHHVA